MTASFWWLIGSHPAASVFVPQASVTYNNGVPQAAQKSSPFASDAENNRRSK
jgi:hypothetical protein